jgi:hypothetical protein
MSASRRGLLAVVVSGILGTGSAWACEVHGSVVCQSDPAVGISGVQVTFTLLADPNVQYSATSGSDGTFGTAVGYLGAFDVNLIAGTDDIVCAIDPSTGSGGPIYMDAIQVDDPVLCPGPPPPPPPPACTVTPPAGITFPYCPARPLGNPKAECGLFKLDVLDKVDASLGASTFASQTAAVAIVKAGGCYAAFYGVVKDVTLLSAPYTQGISHVTYCACPSK